MGADGAAGTGHPLGLRPSTIIAVHVNYRRRAAERGRRPSNPSYFLKPPSSLSWDGADLVRPQGCELMGAEGEIAVIIGTPARNVAVADALRHVAGYAPANDAGVHDLRDCDRGSNLRAKGQDGYTPVGPVLPADGVDPAALVLRTYVNGELAQTTEGDEMLFPVAQLVADLSRTMTLRAGDIILTGTPAGAPVVQPGDVVEVELVGAGRLRNRVVEAPAPLAPVGAMPVASPTARAAAYGPGPRNQPLPPATAALLRRVGTATLSSQLRSRGIDQHSIDGLRPSRPDLRLLGFARTLRYLPLREDVFGRLGGGHNAQKHAVDTLEPDEVLVIDARGEPGAGTVGDILVRRAIRLGAAGVVTDGGLRDTPIVSELDIPVYYRAPHPAVLGRRHVPVDADLPIACGGALVVPGDVLVGDGDGVVVLPRALADEVAAGAAEQERAEQFIAEQVEAGVPLDGLYPMDPATRARYEQWVAERDAADRAAGGTA